MVYAGSGEIATVSGPDTVCTDYMDVTVASDAITSGLSGKLDDVANQIKAPSSLHMRTYACKNCRGVRARQFSSGNVFRSLAILPSPSAMGLTMLTGKLVAETLGDVSVTWTTQHCGPARCP